MLVLGTAVTNYNTGNELYRTFSLVSNFAS